MYEPYIKFHIVWNYLSFIFIVLLFLSDRSHSIIIVNESPTPHISAIRPYFPHPEGNLWHFLPPYVGLPWSISSSSGLLVIRIPGYSQHCETPFWVYFSPQDNWNPVKAAPFWENKEKIFHGNQKYRIRSYIITTFVRAEVSLNGTRIPNSLLLVRACWSILADVARKCVG